MAIIKIYKLPRWLLIFHFSILSIVVIGGSIVSVSRIYYSTCRSDSLGLIIFLGCLSWICYKFITLPIKVLIHYNSSIELRSLIRKNVLLIQDIQSIEFVRGGEGIPIAKVKHRGGILDFAIVEKDYKDFISVIKSMNSAIIIS